MVNNITCKSGNIVDDCYKSYDAIVLFLCKECTSALDKIKLPKNLAVTLESYLATAGDIFGVGELRSLTAVEQTKLVRVIVAGCGEGKECKPNNFRIAAGEVIRELRKQKAKKIAIAAPILLNEKRAHYLQALMEGLYLGAYTFDKYKSDAKPMDLMELTVYNAITEAEAVIQRAAVIAEAVSYARNLVNEPGNVVYPEIMAEKASEVAAEHGLNIEILDEAGMAEHEMQSLIAVGKGSVRKPRLVTLTYNGAKDEPYVAYVGKGITFDSGGISIKPDDNMGEMKDDMTGAACVLGAIKAIAALKLPVNVMAIMACAENMPGGNAQRPGDIVKAANGKTIEVVSTDAEGRMVLADAVWYACKLGAAKVIDIATLTGGVMVALGTKTSGIITNNEELGKELVETGKRAGESLFVLPSLPELKEAIKSEVADLRNSAGRYGSCITGGLFIGEFIKEGTPWAHIDIGGTSTVTETKGFKTIGGTAFGTMTLIRLAGKF
ncbi:MAG: leucyl aminopeptidase [Phascolarctobacterium sp.]|nr:leucyl aminopeptidase [Phascolarctobacterium sp.]